MNVFNFFGTNNCYETNIFQVIDAFLAMVQQTHNSSDKTSATLYCMSAVLAIAKPLNQLTEKDMKFLWTPECDEAFLALKATLTTHPSCFRISSQEPILHPWRRCPCGGSWCCAESDPGWNRACHCVLQQHPRALGTPVLCHSELLAIVKSVKHFHPYLYGRHFIIRTDQGSLQWLLRFKNQEGQMARWLSVLEPYDFESKHQPGA